MPLLAGFAVLLLVARTTAPAGCVTFIADGGRSDVGGYAAGVLFGKHPMAPTISPKKSWEGFAGSAVACVVGGTALLTAAAATAPWWQGVLFGAGRSSSPRRSATSASR